MSTQCFMRSTNISGLGPPYRWSSGNNDTKLDGSSSAWFTKSLATSRGAGYTQDSTATVAGPTNGVEVQGTTEPRQWLSPPLDADLTISGTITFNLWAYESAMNANTAINCVIEKIDGATGVFAQIVQTARVTELGTSAAAANWTETPTSTACKKGDRLRVRVFGDDAGTMGTGFTFIFQYDGTSATNGDSYVTFTETFGFITTDPTSTTLYPTDTASDINPGATLERYLSPSRGAGVQNDVTNSVAGWTAPIQITDTAGGTAVEWYSKPVAAFTLGGAVLVNIRGAATSGSTSTWRCEIAVCDGDGSNPVVWALNNDTATPGTSETVRQFYLSGDDVSVVAGQRLRLRVFIDDPPDEVMLASHTNTLYYAGTTGGASGDTYLTFTQTITESVAARVPHSSPYPQLLAH